MVRLANAAELVGKSLEFLLYTGPLVWGGQSEYWPADIPEAIGKCGMDYDATIKDIQENLRSTTPSGRQTKRDKWTLVMGVCPA